MQRRNEFECFAELINVCPSDNPPTLDSQLTVQSSPSHSSPVQSVQFSSVYFVCHKHRCMAPACFRSQFWCDANSYK